MKAPILVFGFLATITLSAPLTAKGSSTTSVATAADARAANELVRKMEAAYSGVQTYRANFVETRVTAAREEQTRAGRVIVERPFKMSWRFDDDTSRIVSDGTQVVTFDSQRSEVALSSLQGSGHAMSLAFLSEPSQLSRDFQMRSLDPKKLGSASGNVLECTPKQPNKSYRRVLIHVSKRGLVSRVAILHSNGDRTRIDFSDVQLNVDRPALEFFVVPPNGTRIVHL